MSDIELYDLAEKSWTLRLSNLQEAFRNALEVLDKAESRNYKKGIASSCKTLGYCYWRFSDYSLSLTHSLRALDIYKQLGDKKGESDTLNNIGAVYMFQEDHVKRLEVNLRCKDLRSEIGDLEGVASSEGNIGETYFEMGEYEKASTCFVNCLTNPHASPQGKSWAHHNLGRIRFLKKDFDKALVSFRKGLEICESVGYNVLIVDSFYWITEVLIATERYQEAINNAEKGLTVSRKIGAKEGEKKSLYQLSMIYEKLEVFEESLKYHKDYHTLDIEINRDTEIERLKTTQLKVAYEKIEEQKNELVDSIRYAQRIQNALLTRDQNQSLLSNFFVLFEPKDIVSGDFYWYYEKDHTFYIAVADCTGHGVPGAFLTMLGTTFLNEIVAVNEDPTPAIVLERLRARMIKALSQSSGSDSSRDGMDISLMKFNTETNVAEWAGAYNPLWIVRSSDISPIEIAKETKVREGGSHVLYELKADKFPIGYMDQMKPFTNNEIKLEKGDSIYLFSDGFADQFGGHQGKKFLSGRFKDSLLELADQEMLTIGRSLKHTFDAWKMDTDQIDDVCVFGLRID